MSEFASGAPAQPGGRSALLQPGRLHLSDRLMPGKPAVHEPLGRQVVSSAARITAERIIRRVGARGVGLVASSTRGSASLGTTFYFAAGDTGASVQAYLAVANPGSSDAHVRVTFAKAASTARGPSETFTVPAHGRATRNIGRDTVPSAKSGRFL